MPNLLTQALPTPKHIMLILFHFGGGRGAVGRKERQGGHTAHHTIDKSMLLYISCSRQHSREPKRNVKLEEWWGKQRRLVNPIKIHQELTCARPCF